MAAAPSTTDSATHAHALEATSRRLRRRPSNASFPLLQLRCGPLGLRRVLSALGASRRAARASACVLRSWRFAPGRSGPGGTVGDKANGAERFPCRAGLLLEVGYTRIVSFKLLYYYTYLVIGLSLLGIGSGAIAVAMWAPIRRATTERVIALCSLVAAVSIPLGYLVVARLRIDTLAIWDYGSGSSFASLGRLALICFVLFASFVALGMIVATMLGRAGDRVGRLYFADLVGAGLGCMLAIPLITRLGAPAVVMCAALVFALVGLLTVPRRPLFAAGSAVLAATLVVAVVARDELPDVITEENKLPADGPGILFSDWGASSGSTW